MFPLLSFCPHSRQIYHGNVTMISLELLQLFYSWSWPVKRIKSVDCSMIFYLCVLPQKCACRCLGCSARYRNRNSYFPRANGVPRVILLQNNLKKTNINQFRASKQRYIKDANIQTDIYIHHGRVQFTNQKRNKSREISHLWSRHRLCRTLPEGQSERHGIQSYPELEWRFVNVDLLGQSFEKPWSKRANFSHSKQLCQTQLNIVRSIFKWICTSFFFFFFFTSSPIFRFRTFTFKLIKFNNG